MSLFLEKLLFFAALLVSAVPLLFHQPAHAATRSAPQPQVAFEYNEFYGGHPKGYNPFATPVVDAVTVSNVVGTGNKKIADLVRDTLARARGGLPGRAMVSQAYAPGRASQRRTMSFFPWQEGLDKKHITNIYFDNVQLEDSQEWTCKNVEGGAKDVTPAPPKDCFTSS